MQVQRHGRGSTELSQSAQAPGAKWAARRGPPSRRWVTRVPGPTGRQWRPGYHLRGGQSRPPHRTIWQRVLPMKPVWSVTY